MQTDDLLRLQSSIRTVERRLDTFDRALQSIRTIATQRLHRIASSYTAKKNPIEACPSPFSKRVREAFLPSATSKCQSPCLFLLPKPAKRPASPCLTGEKKPKADSPRLVSFGDEVVETEESDKCKPTSKLSDSYQMSDDSSDSESSLKKYVPNWAKLPDLSVNRTLNPDTIFSDLQDSLHQQRKIGFSCHLEDIFPISSARYVRGDSANWQLTNL